MTIRRYVFLAGVAEISVLGDTVRTEMWMGIEAAPDVDLQQFSLDHGYDLIPADGLSADELASIGVTTFVPLECL